MLDEQNASDAGTVRYVEIADKVIGVDYTDFQSVRDKISEIENDKQFRILKKETQSYFDMHTGETKYRVSFWIKRAGAPNSKFFKIVDLPNSSA